MRADHQGDERGDEDADRCARDRSGQGALAQDHGTERSDGDQTPAEASHGPGQVGTRCRDHCRADRDPERGERQLPVEHDRLEPGPFIEDETSDDLADADHEPDGDQQCEAERATLRCERHDHERESEERGEHVGDAPDRIEPVEEVLDRGDRVRLALQLAVGDQARDQQTASSQDEQHCIRGAAPAGLVSARGVDRSPCLDVGDREKAACSRLRRRFGVDRHAGQMPA